MVDFKIGADPEFFLKDKETGQFVSAYGMIEGTKENPIPVKDGAVQVDGMALEFNINPASTENEFVGNIYSVLSDLHKMIDDKYEFVFTPVAEFGKEYIDAQPLEAKRLGCTPDYNAWENGKQNPTPDVELPFRSASGHVHIGWTEDQDIADPDHIEACNMMTMQLDVYLGCAGTVWDLDGKDVIRRQLYGRAGAYRPKSYGVEYRVLSNNWLMAEDRIRYVYQASKEAFDSLMKGQQAYQNHNYLTTQAAINTSNAGVGYETTSYDYYSPTLRKWYGEYTSEKFKSTKVDLDNFYNLYNYGVKEDDLIPIVVPLIEDVEVVDAPPRRRRRI